MNEIKNETNSSAHTLTPEPFGAELTASYSHTINKIGDLAVAPALESLGEETSVSIRHPLTPSAENMKFLEGLSRDRLPVAVAEFIYTLPAASPTQHSKKANPNKPPVTGSDIFELQDPDLNRLRLSEALTWWVKVPDSEDIVGLYRDRMVPMVQIGEKLHGHKPNYSDAKAEMLLAPIVGGVLLDVFTTTVSSVSKDRVDDLSMRKYISPPSSASVRTSYTPHEVQTEYQSKYVPGSQDVFATVYTSHETPLRTISETRLRGAKLLSVPSDDAARERYFAELDEKLLDRGLRADKVTHTTLTPEMLHDYAVPEHLWKLATLFEQEAAFNTLLGSKTERQVA